MKYCNLRIAWLVAWGLLAVFLVVLWVRSYGKGDYLSFAWGSETISLYSERGGFIYEPTQTALTKVGGVKLGSGRYFQQPVNVPPNFLDYPLVRIQTPPAGWFMFVPYWVPL